MKCYTSELIGEWQLVSALTLSPPCFSGALGILLETSHLGDLFITKQLKCLAQLGIQESAGYITI